MSFEFLSHTSEVILKVEAGSKEDLFREALRGEMNFLKKDLGKEQRGRQKREIEVSSVDLEALLVDFLNEVLYYANIYKEVYTDIDIEEFSDTYIKAKVMGFKVDGFDDDIKAVSYHDLKIIYKDNKYICNIIFDV